MITAVDTNVLVDIFGADPRFGNRSAELLRRCRDEGALLACEAVWVETCTAFPHADAFRKAIEKLSVGFSPMEQAAAVKAAEAWRRYRAGGGRRERVASDFLIGAHALLAADRLLTRDRGFYRQYFTGLRILDPSVQD